MKCKCKVVVIGQGVVGSASLWRFLCSEGDVLASAALNGFLSDEVSMFYASRFSVNNK
jgi:hypothetical protein